METCPGQRVRVFVDGTEIPTTEVETRFTGSSHCRVNRISEVNFPLEWRGNDIAGQIQDFDPNNQSDYSMASVFWQDVRGGEYFGRHYGFIRGVGGTKKQGEGRLYIEDPVALMTAIEFSKRYSKPTTKTVLNDVATKFSNNTPFDVSLGSVDIETIDGPDTTDIAGSIADYFISGDIKSLAKSVKQTNKELQTSKSFKENEHTLKDVMTWLINVGESGEYWFSGAKPLKIIYDTDDSQRTNYVSTAITGKEKVGEDRNLKYGGSYRPSDGPAIDVITNDALSELFPVNSISVAGKSSWSINGFRVKELASDKYPFSTVEEPTLKKRAGGKTIRGQIHSTDDKTLNAVENSAKKILKRKITGSGDGEVEAFLTPLIIPGDTVELVPECNDFAPNATLNPIKFQVNTVRHHKKSTDEGRTYIGVSPMAKRSNMNVVESEMRQI